MVRPAKRLKVAPQIRSNSNLESLNVLVVGAGGLGCEIVKNLAASGFRQISIIDLDTIELTNLNRQFLFTENSIGLPKAEVAATKIAEMVPGCVPKAYVDRIENMPDSFYQQFHMVVCGLDSVSARRFINAKLVELCFSDPSPSSLRPLIDGGSQAFRGQCRVILPGITPCYECTLSLLTEESVGGYPLCTLASIPRLPEHCIEWSRVIAWPRNFKRDPDLDNAEDVQWLYSESVARAEEFAITGVSLELVYGVLKHIVPAVASTNAIIAGSCCIEALKLALGHHTPLDNYFMYAGDHGTFTSVIPFQKRDDCPVCGSQAGTVHIDGAETLLSLVKQLKSKLHCNTLPSVTGVQTYYMHSPPSLCKLTEQNLATEVRKLCQNGEELVVSHSDLPSAVRVQLYINE